MLRNIDPLLGPELLMHLRAMGHGDEIALVDANFPATTMAQRLVRLDGVSVTRAAEAVLSVLPFDAFVETQGFTMQVVGDPEAEQPIFDEFRGLVRSFWGPRARLGGIERFAFYERTRRAYAVVATGETRLYGNLILVKGVIQPSSDEIR